MFKDDPTTEEQIDFLHQLIDASLCSGLEDPIPPGSCISTIYNVAPFKDQYLLEQFEDRVIIRSRKCNFIVSSKEGKRISEPKDGRFTASEVSCNECYNFQMPDTGAYHRKLRFQRDENPCSEKDAPKSLKPTSLYVPTSNYNRTKRTMDLMVK